MPHADGKDAFKERVNIILDEVSLGIQWERPSIIVVVYRSEHTRNLVQAILAKSLGKSGQVVLHYTVDRYHYDIPLELQAHPQNRPTVFFVSGVRWGGGRGYSNAYRALNMHRENLVEGKIKAIFWLTTTEVRQLARFSPDFWAFRHKVVEFPDLPARENTARTKTSNGSFHNRYTTNTNDFQIRIKSAETFYTLGCIDEAILDFRKALRKYPEERAIYLQIAEIYLSVGRLPAARRMLRKAGKGKPGQVHFSEELNRLNQTAKLIHTVSGGFSEQTR